ncbi:hypothetical protein BUE80_DR000638 [Diplocarpon rosae]|nr:hypothetical protein BUE80_DR000638 [Diplocarpon rosae]
MRPIDTLEELLRRLREAQGADKAAVPLQRIREELGSGFFQHITAVLREIESCSRLLRDFCDAFLIHESTVAIIIYHLSIIIPTDCLPPSSRTLGEALQFRPWSESQTSLKQWMALFFKTWTNIAVPLGHCSSKTLLFDHEERYARGCRSAGKITDDGLAHSLTVFQNNRCGGIRRHAAVKSEELRLCPVWTAFSEFHSPKQDYFPF